MRSIAPQPGSSMIEKEKKEIEKMRLRQ